MSSTYKMYGKCRKKKFCQFRRLQLEKEEIDTVGYYLIPKVYRQLKSPVGKTDKIINALKKKDILASRCHFHPQGLKINADIEKVKKILKKISP